MEHTPGLKSLSDAIRIRRKVLRAFELADMEHDFEKRAKLMIIAVVGADLTGVEPAGAFAGLAGHEDLRGGISTNDDKFITLFYSATWCRRPLVMCQ